MVAPVLAGDGFTHAFIFICGIFGLVYAAYQTWIVAKVKVPEASTIDDRTRLNSGRFSEVHSKVAKLYKQITNGANVFLFAEYRYMAVFLVVFGALVFGLVGSAGICGQMTKVKVCPVGMSNCAEEACPADAGPADCRWIETAGECWGRGGLSAVAFLIGGVTSIVSGYIGMKIAVFANARTALECQTRGGEPEGNAWMRGFNMAFRAGSVMGFSLCSLALLVLYVTLLVFNYFQPYNDEDSSHGAAEALMEAIAGYGLGGSSIAMFGRVGGGIYTKAADVGADLVGKNENGMDEDDPRNCATIADNVGDNVGDVAGMGADLFGSFAESTCAALVVASTSPDLNQSWSALMYPLYISALGIVVGFVTSLFAVTKSCAVRRAKDVFTNLKYQLWISTILMTPFLALISWYTLPQAAFCIKPLPSGVCAPGTDSMETEWWKCFLCVASGLWGGLVIGLVTEYMTSYEHEPTREVARSTETGTATNIIFGLALGYKSVIVPIFALAVAIYLSFTLADMYGIALAALGMLSTLSIGLAIDAYGPITDNAGGIAEMSGMDERVREKTDVLDAAGNTTAAIGKGFAIGSAALVSLALFGAFVTRANIATANILKPITFSGLLVGAMLPYWFTAMTMKSVGIAAQEMVMTVRAIFKEHERKLFRLDEDGNRIMRNGAAVMLEPGEPGYEDPMNIPGYYDEPIRVSTESSLREMFAPGALVMFSPIICGFFFGVNCVTGLLAGGMVSGVQMAISQSNTGGAWDNAKKYIEAKSFKTAEFRNATKAEQARMLRREQEDEEKDGDDRFLTYYPKGSDVHKAAVVGDTVGDPLKDTSGPALNILMKLMAIISLVFAPFFTAHSVCKTLGTC